MAVRSGALKDTSKKGEHAQPGGSWAWRWYMCSGEDAQGSPEKPHTHRVGGTSQWLGGWGSLGKGRWPSYVFLISISQFHLKSLFHYLSQHSLNNHLFKNCLCFKETVTYQYFSRNLRYIKIAVITFKFGPSVILLWTQLYPVCYKGQKRKKKILYAFTHKELYKLDSSWSSEFGMKKKENCTQQGTVLGQQCLWAAPLGKELL